VAIDSASDRASQTIRRQVDRRTQILMENLGKDWTGLAFQVDSNATLLVVAALWPVDVGQRHFNPAHDVSESTERELQPPLHVRFNGLVDVDLLSMNLNPHDDLPQERDEKTSSDS